MLLPLKLQPDMQTTKWKNILDPLLKNPLNNVTILKDISLVAGNNTISHKLGRKPQGWIIVDINAASNIYRYQDSTDLFLYLNSSNNAVISLGVF